MSGDLTTDVGDMLMTQVALLVPFLASYVDVTHRWSVQIILDELSKTPDYVFEGAAGDKEVCFVFWVEEGPQGWQDYGAGVKIPDGWPTLYHLAVKYYVKLDHIKLW